MDNEELEMIKNLQTQVITLSDDDFDYFVEMLEKQRLDPTIRNLPKVWDDENDQCRPGDETD